MKEQLKAFWKRLLSYTKSSWDVHDYPLRYKNQASELERYNVGELKTWNLQVINWWTMGGLGNTKEEAFENFKSNFRNYLEHNKAPRPGTKVPLAFASTLIESILNNHPFIDGNKRTGYVLMRLFLLRYGRDINASQEDKYEFVINIASGKIRFEEIVSWLEKHSV